MAKQFTLYKRDTIYYVNFSTVTDGHRARMSTGCRSKSEALIFVARKLEEMTVNHEMLLNDTFGKLARDWWLDGSCPYQKESRRNGRELTRSYMAINRRLLLDRILPRFGTRKVSAITSGMIDDWKYDLHEQEGLSGKSCNTYLTVLRTMFDYWWRHGMIHENPCLKVRWMRKEPVVRGILTDDEVRLLFSTKEAWCNPMAYLANVLAACTGLRMGEVQGLRTEDLMPDGSIMVRHSYDERYGLKCTKTGTIRRIPLPQPLYSALLSASPEKNGYIFIFDNGALPMRRSCILRNMRNALKRVGISLEDQKDRKICFHSWRHYLNSRLRVSGLPDVVVKAVTGHSTDQMMEHYTHISVQDAQSVASVAQRVLPDDVGREYTYVKARDAGGKFI